MRRRKFAKNIAKGAALMTLSSALPLTFTSRKKLNVLVLGGTYFAGPAIVKALVKNGHQVTLFNRGITNPDLFPELSQIRGDRFEGEAGYKELLAANRNWDAIIDVWPQESHLVDDATRLLQARTNHYLFISSIAVYNDFSKPEVKEESGLVPLLTDRSKWEYSEHKVASENFVKDRFPENHTILRCGPIKGWRDDALEIPFWLTKIKEGEVVGPGNGSDVIQFIDVMDIGNFVALSTGKGLLGTYNLNGPTRGEYTWKEFLQAAKKAINPKAKIYWAKESFLRENGVRPWDQMPLWLPNRIDPGFFRISIEKAVQSGLKFTDLEKTLKDQYDWYSKHIQLDGDHQFGIGENPGLTLEKHQELIELLKN